MNIINQAITGQEKSEDTSSPLNDIPLLDTVHHQSYA